ncbi:hypothetical protein Y032_0022g597 [Ancylostoma ceylanicum]|uniref:18S rRNA (guanine(1575)-N(7))-methyltransferase Bud23 C-terminal domain-containing protein n=2 Tax=Ancylostoma ceylanicum TaxID=53326 RepID=A0A016UYX0_9BILA|nr:hypothetical protein Y032_0022g597 [Ancylostoma ceylanicum]
MMIIFGSNYCHKTSSSEGRGTRAVFQFYPENEHQSALIMTQATKAGFNGGLVVDYPNSVKAKKVYLVLMTGGIAQLPKALTGEEEAMEHQAHVENTGRTFSLYRKHEKKPSKGSKEWINKKRERMLKQGRRAYRLRSSDASFPSTGQQIDTKLQTDDAAYAQPTLKSATDESDNLAVSFVVADDVLG